MRRRSGTAPRGSCWLSPRGKRLSWRDPISIRLPEEDLQVLRRLIDAAFSHLDEARGSEERVPFAARLVRLQEEAQGDDELVVRRDDLPALHGVLHVAAGRVHDALTRGADHRADFVRRLVRIRRLVNRAVCDHDDIPEQERYDG